MFCKNCGKQLKDNAKFCNECGHKVGEDVTEVIVEPIATVAKKENKSKKLLLIPIVIAIMIAVKVIVPFFSTSSDVDKVVDKYVDAYLSGDGKAMVELMHDEQLTYIMVYSDVTKEDIIDVFEENADYVLESLEEKYGKNFKYSHEIIGKEKYISEEDIDYIRYYLTAGYENNFSNQIEKAVSCDIAVTFKCNGITEETEFNLLLVEIDSKWYVAE